MAKTDYISDNFVSPTFPSTLCKDAMNAIALAICSLALTSPPAPAPVAEPPLADINPTEALFPAPARVGVPTATVTVRSPYVLPSTEQPPAGQLPSASPTFGPVTPNIADAAVLAPQWVMPVAPARGFLESDHAFDNFVGPITNPILAKDPRSNTYVRFLFIHNTIPGENALGGGDFQVWAAQINLALTERLSFIADKDGFATIAPGVGGNADGWLNIAAGLKYTFYRDVENQALAALGFLYEVPSGSTRAFQGQGNGVWTVFATGGKEFGLTHLLGTFGYQFPTTEGQNSGFLYGSLHLDRQFFGWLYPLIEINWFTYNQSGNRGIPAGIGEGDGLLNLGTSNVVGNTLVTGAIGVKALFSQNLIGGVAWEVPLSNRKDLIDNRLTVELILRY